MLGISKIHSSSFFLFRSASDYDINIYRLIFEVSLQNIKNINRKNINIVAKELSRIKNKLYFYNTKDKLNTNKEFLNEIDFESLSDYYNTKRKINILNKLIHTEKYL